MTRRQVRARVAAWSCGIAVAAIGAAGVMHAQAPKAVPLALTLPDGPTAGAKLFVQKACVRCHSLGGDEVRMGPDLGRIHFPGTALDLAGSFWNHAPVMAEKMRDLKIPQPTLDSHEMADLLAFLTAYRYYLTEVGAPANPATGRKVFEQKGCARCHSGEATAAVPAPVLTRSHGQFSAIALAQAMWNHGSAMAGWMRRSGVPWPNFSGAEMGDLLAYLQASNSVDATERVYFEPGSPRRGKDLFASKQCVQCHAIAGVGGRGGPDLGARGHDMLGSVAQLAGLMWNHRQGMEAEFERRGLTRVTFSGQEMADIIAYLYFVNYANVQGVPVRGAEIFREKCGACHAAAGGVHVGPDLTSIPALDDPIAIFAAMWNHAPRMEQQLRQQGIAWPRLAPGEAADLAAFLVSRRPQP